MRNNDSQSEHTNHDESHKLHSTEDQSRIKMNDKSRTPAQDRLQKLVESQYKQDATQVLCNSFSIKNNSNLTLTLCENMDMDWESCQDSNHVPQYNEDMAVEASTDPVYVIPDTNVFIDSLISIEMIIKKECRYDILIPFVVLQELDQLKCQTGKYSVCSKASSAIQYIYEQLRLRNPRLQGQKAADDKVHVIDVASPDDRILNCCLQFKNRLMDIILVTNDKNLSNKALLNGIETINSRECMGGFN